MKKIIITLLIALSFIALAVVCKNAFSYRIPIHNRGIREAVNQGNLDVLFVGSSTFRSNISIELLDEKYDGRDYIIAYGGNRLAASDIQYDEIRNRSNSDINLMVFELSPLMFTEDVSLSDSRVIWDLSWDGKKALYKKMKEAGNAGPAVTYEYFVTSGMDDLLTYPITEPFYATRYNKGAKTGEVISPGRDVLENAEFDISDLQLVAAQEEAVIDLTEKAKRDNQPILFLESPCYHRLTLDPTYLKCREHMINFINEHDVDCIYSTDVDFDNTNADFFEDINHMSTSGKTEYTKLLLRKLDTFQTRKH